MNAYRNFVSDFAKLFRRGRSLPLVKASPGRLPKLKPNASVALIFSPHPDDECITGALALRLRREAGFRVVNIAVTLGSKASRRKARLAELSAACKFLGFELEQIAPGGLGPITPVARVQEPKRWETAVRLTAALLWRHQPAVVFLPHAHDWHPTHIGTHWLVMDALATLPATFTCTLVETEFWGAMTAPNLMVESGETDVADLVAALSLHAGEVWRNPYHLRLPAWMQDNVRRGAELVGGAGGKAPRFVFATLYRVSRRVSGVVAVSASRKKLFSRAERMAGIFS
jgi:LmbE family N-acetylglucosaminyl deacetylase